MTTKEQFIKYVKTGVLISTLGACSGVGSTCVALYKTTQVPEAPQQLQELCQLESELEKSVKAKELIEDSDRILRHYSTLAKRYEQMKNDPETERLQEEYDAAFEEYQRKNSRPLALGGIFLLTLSVLNLVYWAYQTEKRYREGL